MELTDHIQESIIACDRFGESLDELRRHLMATNQWSFEAISIEKAAAELYRRLVIMKEEADK